jgi:lipoprotein-releasing system permease protein
MIFKFAWRYLFGKKSTQAINIISWVSIIAMAVSTAALIIVLSVFNGFEFFIKDLYTDFYPEIKITAIQGKTFNFDSTFEIEIAKLNNIQYVSKSLEDKVLFLNNETQVIANLKGIDTTYYHTSNFQHNIHFGGLNDTLPDEYSPIVLGLGVSNRLGANEESGIPIQCYSFKSDQQGINLDPTNIYNTQLFLVTGIYALQEEIDNQYAFAPLSVVQSLTEKYNQFSSLELKLNNPNEGDIVKKQLQPLLAKYQLKAETRYEQNKTLYFILKSERWAVFAILTLMLIIASFNIIGSLSMLVIEKEKDISILKTMGMTNYKIKSIFLSTGVFISLFGASLGAALALLICLLQQHFKLIKLGSEGSFLIEAYPVKLQLVDFIMIFATVLIISILASWIPAIKASKKEIELRVR